LESFSDGSGKRNITGGFKFETTTVRLWRKLTTIK